MKTAALCWDLRSSLGNVADQQRLFSLFSCFVAVTAEVNDGSKFLWLMENLQQLSTEGRRITGTQTDKVMCEMNPARLDLHPDCDMLDFLFHVLKLSELIIMRWKQLIVERVTDSLWFTWDLLQTGIKRRCGVWYWDWVLDWHQAGSSGAQWVFWALKYRIRTWDTNKTPRRLSEETTSVAVGFIRRGTSEFIGSVCDCCCFFSGHKDSDKMTSVMIESRSPTLRICRKVQVVWPKMKMSRLPFLSAGPLMIWLTSYFEVLQETVATMIREHS